MSIADPAEEFFRLPLQRVAVVLIDFQNDFCSPEVFGDRPVTNTANARAAERANRFAGQAAELGAKVVYTQQLLDVQRLTFRQQRWEQPGGLCSAGTWGADLFVDPVPGSTVVIKHRFDSWQSQNFVSYLEDNDIDGLVLCGVELVCCVLYAVLGAEERGYHYLIPEDLVSGQDLSEQAGNKAVRELFQHHQSGHLVPSSDDILQRWRQRQS